MSIHKSLTVRAIGVALLVIASTATSQADAIDDFVAAQMKARHIPGLAIAVVKDGKPVKVRGYGVANLELGAPVTADSVFYIGSLSKQIIAVAVMKLVQDGRLTLDDTAVRFLDGAPGGFEVFLLPGSSRVFFAPDDPRVHFEFDRAEATWRMTRYINGKTANVAMKE